MERDNTLEGVLDGFKETHGLVFVKEANEPIDRLLDVDGLAHSALDGL